MKLNVAESSCRSCRDNSNLDYAFEWLAETLLPTKKYQKDRCYVAFSFADEDEADDFFDKVTSVARHSRNSASSLHSYNSNHGSQKLSVASMDRPYGAPTPPQFASHTPGPQLPQRAQTQLAVPPSINKSLSAPMGASVSVHSSDIRSSVKDDSDIKKESGGGGWFSFGKKKKEDSGAKKDQKEKKKKSGSGSGKVIDKSMIGAPTNFE
ncbi:hypothetical protein HDU81_001871 [Chytriomyces hyalinus]|nr:hypothetical protein HDU81_001871 [Chytriomyces hyalinus]